VSRETLGDLLLKGEGLERRFCFAGGFVHRV
jgi:hypothetical protein